MFRTTRGPSRPSTLKASKFVAPLVFITLLILGYSHASMQSPVLDIDIDQAKLLQGEYTQQHVLQAGGQFWTTPFTRYDAKTKMGDGYGEGGADAPRALQRRAFNPSGWPSYPFLRLNGLDSQSCYECHNSIGSDPGYGPGTPLIRKQPSSVGGSAGSNSNAFINPCFPSLLTLFIRQPPHVFGSGYIQTISDEITRELQSLRKSARQTAMAPGNQGHPQSIRLLDTKHNIDYGTFTTTYTGAGWVGNHNQSVCPPLTCQTPHLPASNALRTLASPSRTLRGNRQRNLSAVPSDDDLDAVMAPGFTEELGQIKGISFDLIVRPFQWKGIASSLRHFVEGALDFHFSMQATEIFDSCDCDKDGKTNEISVGQVSAISAFVGMTRPPQQVVPAGVTNESVQRGYQIFTATAGRLKLPQQMCATCHTPSLPITDPNPTFVVDDAKPPQNFQCLATKTKPSDCPAETAGFGTSLLIPVKSHEQLDVLKRIKTAASPRALGTTPTEYDIPLNSTDVPPSALPRLTQTAPFFLPFLPQPGAGGFYVPLFSDLRTHNMGSALLDLAAQGTDVTGVCVQPSFFLTRPLWGVADTGPWLHDGRATSLLQAILLHGDSTTGSEAGPIIDAFKKLSNDDKQAVVNLLLSLRLPIEQTSGSMAAR